MIELAHHINPLTSIPGHFLFGLVLAIVFLPTSMIVMALGYWVPKPFGVVLGMAVGILIHFGVLYMYNCWGCPDHEIYRRFLDPGSLLIGGLFGSFLLARWTSGWKVRRWDW